MLYNLEENGSDTGEGAVRQYIYLGDRLTDARFKGKRCVAVERNGKCICGKNATMLVEFESGEQCNVLRRRLRKTANGTGRTPEKEGEA